MHNDKIFGLVLSSSPLIFDICNLATKNTPWIITQELNLLNDIEKNYLELENPQKNIQQTISRLMLQSVFDRINVLIIDSELENQNKNQLSKYLQEKNPQISILWLSYFFSEQEIQEINNNNNSFFLAKPFSIADLTKNLAKIERCLINRENISTNKQVDDQQEIQNFNAVKKNITTNPQIINKNNIN